MRSARTADSETLATRSDETAVLGNMTVSLLPSIVKRSARVHRIEYNINKNIRNRKSGSGVKKNEKQDRRKPVQRGYTKLNRAF
jgi:hypothetical protein